jgi:hypothetical protein
MKLCEHPDFRQAVVQAAEHFADRGLRPALIEKDYYVTETLRIIAMTVGEKIIFKGARAYRKAGILSSASLKMSTFSLTRTPSIRCSAETGSIESSRRCATPSRRIRP